jgi:hypothetical protein
MNPQLSRSRRAGRTGTMPRRAVGHAYGSVPMRNVRFKNHHKYVAKDV